MDLLRAFEIFVQTVEAGSLSAAARRLRLTTSAVSKQIAALEGDLGAALMVRTTRGLSLTDAGRDFLQRSRTILTEVAALRAALHDGAETGGLQGTLRISAPPNFGRFRVARIVRRFAELHPRMKIEFTLTTRQVDLVADQIDVAVRVAILEDSSLVANRLMQVMRVMVASPSYLERRGVPPWPAALSDHSCLVESHVTPDSKWYFRHGSGEDAVAVTVTGNISSDDTLVLHEAALEGHGIALLPNWLVAADLKAGRLTRLIPDWSADIADQPRYVYAVLPAMDYTPAKTRAFIALLRDDLTNEAD